MIILLFALAFLAMYYGRWLLAGELAFLMMIWQALINGIEIVMLEANKLSIRLKRIEEEKPTPPNERVH